MSEIIKQLEQVLVARKNKDVDNSYVKSLYSAGDEKIVKKLIEETAEVLIAVKDNDKKQIIYESADLLFHLLVLLTHKDIKLEEVYQELERRFGISGIVEKQNRKK